jgi:hypothetical protein
MENLKEIAVIVVGTWAAVEVFKELLNYYKDYQDNWYRKQTQSLMEALEEMKSQLPKKGKK